MPRRLRNTPRLIDACRSLTSVGFCCCSVVEQPLFFHAIVCRPFALLVAPHFSRQPSRDSMSRERRRHSYEEGSLALTLGLVCVGDLEDIDEHPSIRELLRKARKTVGGDRTSTKF